jgi:hypothetical protein
MKINDQKILSILKKNSDVDGKSQLISNIVDLMDITQKSSLQIPVSNINIESSTINFYKNNQWHTTPICKMIKKLCLIMHAMCLRVKYSLSDIIDLSIQRRREIVYRQDPLNVTKHLDMIINDGDCYNWGGGKIISYDEMVHHMTQRLSFYSQTTDSDNGGDAVSHCGRQLAGKLPVSEEQALVQDTSHANSDFHVPVIGCPTSCKPIILM